MTLSNAPPGRGPRFSGQGRGQISASHRIWAARQGSEAETRERARGNAPLAAILADDRADRRGRSDESALGFSLVYQHFGA